MDNKQKKVEKKLTSSESEDVKKRFGTDLECSFAKDDNGYFCYTHRARSKSYKSIEKIPMGDFKFISSTS